MAFINKLHLSRYFNIYRIITGVCFIGAAVLILATPLQLPDPDDWANYIGTKHYAQGEYILNTRTMYTEAYEIGKLGGTVIQFLPLGPNKWALEKAPGYILYLVPFYKMGIQRWGNILLALGMIIVTYILLKRLRNEKAAMIGSLLMLFTPIGLVMLNRVYMDTFASLAFFAIGGGLYLYYHLERERLKPWAGAILLFLAFFFVGWSVISRYSNALLGVVMGLHWLITRIIAWRRGQKTGIKWELAPLIIGTGLPVLAFLLYNYYIFGSLLTYGYSLSPYPIHFAYNYIGQADMFGKSIAGQILLYNLEAYGRNLFIGFPLLIIGIPAFVLVLYQKIVGIKKGNASGTWSSLRAEMPWDIFLVLIGWFFFVFPLYWGYEWTAGLQKGGGAVVFDRFLLPGLFPIVIICALVMARFPYKVLIPVLALLTAYGVMFYVQWDYSKLHILPAWVTERTLVSRWKDYIFPPWCQTADEIGPKLYPWYMQFMKK